MKKLIAIAAALVLLMAMAAPVAAQNNSDLNRLNAIAEATGSDASNVVEVFDGDNLIWYVVSHCFPDRTPFAAHDADEILWCEPQRYGNELIDVTQQTQDWNVVDLWLYGPDNPGFYDPPEPVHHKGRVKLFFRFGEDWYSVTTMFNGKGNLLSINGDRYSN